MRLMDLNIEQITQIIMNLPSIFKSAPNMKPSPASTSQKQSKNNQIYNDVPQDMFGLGIQVFKISSKKDIASTNSNAQNHNNRSVGKARQEIQVLQNPKRTSAGPVIPKPKKTSAILPSITKTPSQKQQKMQGVIKTDSILRKSIQKQQQPTSKFDAIPEYPSSRPIQKNKPFTTGRPINKSVDAVPQPQTQPLLVQKCINKEQWRNSLNVLRKFYTQFAEFKANQTTKVGRKRNVDFVGECDGFVDAYITNNWQGAYFQDDEELYEPYSIESYQIQGKEAGFQNVNYEDYSVN